MIPKGTTLFPEWFDSSQMYYCDMPFAYWLGGNICEWVLYKEYNDYKSICHPNDCLCGISKEELLERFRTFSWYKEEDRENLYQAFRLCKIHNTQFIEDKTLRDHIINECSHELACFCDFLDNKKGYEILEYKKNTLFE